MHQIDKRKGIVVSILMIFIIFSLTGLLTSFQQKIVLSPAQNYVLDAQEKALAAFITISIVKGLVAVIEGSEVAGIEVGDIVQPLYDSINITWELITASLATLYILEIILKICQFLGPWILIILFILIGVMQFFAGRSLKRATLFFAVLGFVVYFAIPASLFFSGKISNNYSKSIQEEFAIEMEHFKTEYEARFQTLEDVGLIEISGWPPTVTGSFPDYVIHWPDLQNISLPKYQVAAAIFTDMKDLIEVLPELLLKTGATWLLDIMIIPLGMLFILYKVGIFFIKTFIDDSRAEKLREGVSSSLKKKLGNS